MTATIVPLDYIDIEQINNAFIWSVRRYLAEATVNGARGEIREEMRNNVTNSEESQAARLSSARLQETEPLRRVIR